MIFLNENFNKALEKKVSSASENDEIGINNVDIAILRTQLLRNNHNDPPCFYNSRDDEEEHEEKRMAIGQKKKNSFTLRNSIPRRYPLKTYLSR